VAASETITVLFTDLVGSTELISALTTEAADQLRRAHFAALRRAIIPAGGTEVKNLGDGLMVVFPSTSAALSCAVAMEQAVDRENALARRPLGLRIGLSGGEATRESDDFFGDPVVEAARLCSQADAGQILATDAVRVMAGRRTRHTFNRLGAFDLKGLPVPIEVLEVGWEPIEERSSEHEFPLPARIALEPPTGVVARESEVTELIDNFKRVAAGDGRAVTLVSGEAGVGKTTLVAEAARRAAGDGAWVLLGRCQEDAGASYVPVAEALGHLVTNAPEQVLRDHVAVYGGTLASMVPAFGQRMGELAPPTTSDLEAERYVLYGAVTALLVAVSNDRPTVLVLDDLQWSDSPTLHLLRYVIANAESNALYVLGTFRDTEVSPSSPLNDLLGALRREPRVGRVHLEGFDDAGVLAFVEAAAGQHLEGRELDLARAVCRETEGNPFFVGEVLRSLIETGAVYRNESGRWSAAGDWSEIELPNSVREVISARVARLGAAAGQVLTMAAVIGREFDFDLLESVTGIDPEEVIAVLDAASSAALLREVSEVPGRFTFSHALTQHTLYQQMGAVRRSRAHRQVAEAIEANPARRLEDRGGELAHHWLNAPQPASCAKAMDYARKAGDAALAALAPDDAVRYFSKALQLLELAPADDPQFECDLQLALGEAERQSGIPGFRRAFLDAARLAEQIGSTDRLVAAALGNSRGFFSSIGVIDVERVAVLESALSALPGDDSNDRALLLATLCSELALGTTLERRQALADAARSMARRLGDPTTVVRTLNLVCDPLQVPSTLAERMIDAREAAELADALDDPDLRFWTSAYARMAAEQAGDFAWSRRCLDSMRSVISSLRQPGMLWVTLFNEAAQGILTGNPEQAEQLATAALAVGTESGQPDALSFYGAEMIGIRSQQGRLGELVPMIEQMAEANPDLVVFHATLAAGYLQAGDLDGARRLLEAAIVDIASVPYDVLWIFALANYSEVASELRAEDSALRLLELLAPFDDQVLFIGATAGSSVAYHCASLESVLGRYEDADRHFAMASECHLRGGMQYSTALTDLLWGRMLVARAASDDRALARERLTRAQSAALGHGYTSIADRAATALASLP
jgi:class 3 adenylate cyclase/tetratricopeptide (TPR) repeat protein